MQAEKIARLARKNISKFCIEECKSYCCRKGYLVLTESGLPVVLKGKEKDYKDSLKKTKGRRLLTLHGKKVMPKLNRRL